MLHQVATQGSKTLKTLIEMTQFSEKTKEALEQIASGLPDSITELKRLKQEDTDKKAQEQISPGMEAYLEAKRSGRFSGKDV